MIYEDHERSFQRLRNLGVPKAPKNIEDIRKAFSDARIYDFYCKTDHEDHREIFFDHLHQSTDFSYCVFSSKKIIEFIRCKSEIGERNYLIDATFKVVPIGTFKQLLVIHYMKFDTVHPFVYILMSNKSQIAYAHVFKYIDTNIFSLRCSSFTTDYETGLKNALRSLFPNSRLVSCWFHFTQAIRRRATKSKSPLGPLIGSNEAVTKLYYKFQALALLHKNKILATFEELKEEALALNETAFTSFLKYYEDQWIKKVGNYTLLSTHLVQNIFQYFQIFILLIDCIVCSRKDQSPFRFGC